MAFRSLLASLCLVLIFQACGPEQSSTLSAADILGNPDYPAFSYGGYRKGSREEAPSVAELKEDMKILAAMGIKLLRTYNTQQFAHAANLLKAIRELKDEDANFEMYVMLGTWIECKGAWTDNIDHSAGNEANNTAEVEAAIQMANEYPDIVKVIAVGNEAMVKWAAGYFVEPEVILKWVIHLQALKASGGIPAETWITSSDNYESWGGGSNIYHNPALVELMRSVDFISLHTYPIHDSHYNPAFWGVPDEQEGLSTTEQIDKAMARAADYAKSQYEGAKAYMEREGINKPIHIGETGWATIASSSYGATGSKAADEYKEKLYYDHMRQWTEQANMSCFYFEAFDEQWKDAGNPLGSENHFGLINLKGEAKYALWDMVDAGTFEGLTRNGKAITKTYEGKLEKLMEEVLTPPLSRELGILEITTVNNDRAAGSPVSEANYVLVHKSMVPDGSNDMTYPNSKVKLNAWEGTCGIEMDREGVIHIKTGTGEWWGSALELMGAGENFSEYANGYLNLEIKGTTKSAFELGFQTGTFAKGDQVNNGVAAGNSGPYKVIDKWLSYRIPVTELNQGANLKNVTGLLYIRGLSNFDGKDIEIRNVYYAKE